MSTKASELLTLLKSLPVPTSPFVSGTSPSPVVSLAGKDDPATLEQLLRLGRPAAVGVRGLETVVDKAARKTLVVPGATVQWPGLTEAVEAARQGLYPAEPRLTPQLHSVLVYRPGDHFAVHRDSIKCPGHVATLSVDCGLGGERAGGAVQFGDDPSDGAEPAFPLPVWLSDGAGAWAAWVTSQRHSVLPLLSGHRVVATFNLVRDEADATAAEPRPCPFPALTAWFSDSALATAAAQYDPVARPVAKKGAKKKANGVRRLGLLLQSHHITANAVEIVADPAPPTQYGLAPLSRRVITGDGAVMDPRDLTGRDRLLFDAAVAAFGRARVEVVPCVTYRASNNGGSLTVYQEIIHGSLPPGAGEVTALAPPDVSPQEYQYVCSDESTGGICLGRLFPPDVRFVTAATAYGEAPDLQLDDLYGNDAHYSVMCYRRAALMVVVDDTVEAPEWPPQPAARMVPAKKATKKKRG